jgi:tRNA pseudouridine38-40 synthase
MVATFHARFSATARRYRYAINLAPDARSPFANRFAWPWEGPRPDAEALASCARDVLGDHAFHGFAVRGTAPADDDHHCVIGDARWTMDGDALDFHVEANRFLHHMVRFLVGTMMDVATGKRPRADFPALLAAEANDEVSPPAPARGLSLEHVAYPDHLYART